MTREEFDNMEIEKQIEHINELLKNSSLNKICDAIGISRAGISKRFKQYGYMFNENSYVPEEEIINKDDILKGFLLKLEELREKITVLEQKSNSNITEVQQVNNSNPIRFYKNDTIVRAYRIDDEIYQRFKHYTDENKQFKISDIISTALEDFLNKVDK